MRLYSKPLYLFEREVVVYNDLKKNGPANLETINQRLGDMDLIEVTKILKDLSLRNVIVRSKINGESLFRIKQEAEKFKILKRPARY